MKIQLSNDTFRFLRESESYYIDKTGMLETYLNEKFEKAVLFARPRRFGKTMTMTMFRDFLDIRQDSKKIFDGLKIMKYKETVESYMNKYPVIFTSLKEVSGESFEAVLKNLKIMASKLYEEHIYLRDSPNVSDISKIPFEEILRQKSATENTIQALDHLSKMLKQHYNKPAFVIIDEYDVPMARTLNTPAYEQTRKMIEKMLSYICKTNENVKGVILSGCLYTVKNSTYTGLNNIIPYTVLNPNYASSIGFTDSEVKKLLSDAGISNRYETVKEWYDGYIFGREKMYCPWDVLRYVNSILDGSYSEAMGPESYWVNTSETSLDIIHGFLGKTSNANETFEKLLADKTIDCVVNENLTYHNIHSDGENIWSALLETGYLTKAVTERMSLMPLKIPNRGIKNVFRHEVWDFFKDKLDNIFIEDLVNSLWSNEIKNAEKALNQILEATLSFYHEYHEYSYHLILDGFFTGRGYQVLSETESGYGRSDLIIKDPARNRCLILELKHVKTKQGLTKALSEASNQIIEQKYESTLKYEGYNTIIKYAMVFCDKKSQIKNA